MWKFVFALVIAYLGWRMWKGAPKRSASRPTPSDDERLARALLGVAPGASAEEIRSAHRTLMANAHPDRGGSDRDARALNAARDLLLTRAA